MCNVHQRLLVFLVRYCVMGGLDPKQSPDILAPFVKYVFLGTWGRGWWPADPPGRSHQYSEISEQSGLSTTLEFREMPRQENKWSTVSYPSDLEKAKKKSEVFTCRQGCGDSGSHTAAGRSPLAENLQSEPLRKLEKQICPQRLHTQRLPSRGVHARPPGVWPRLSAHCCLVRGREPGGKRSTPHERRGRSLGEQTALLMQVKQCVSSANYLGC